MAPDGNLNPESETFEARPPFYIGQHDSSRTETLSDDQYRQVLNSGASQAPRPLPHACIRCH